MMIIGPVYPIRGGNALFLGHLANAIKERHQLKVINFTKLYPKLLFPGTRQHDISQKPMKPIEAEEIIDSTNPLTWLEAAKRIRDYKPKRLIFSWWNPFFALLTSYLAKVGKSVGAKVVIITENIVSHENRLADKLLTRLGLRYAQCFIALSKDVESKLSELYPNMPIHRASLPVYDCYRLAEYTKDKAREKLGLSGNVALFFGYVRKYKGLSYLIDGFAQALEHVQMRLLIVGEFYDDIKRYRTQIKKLGIEDKVIIVPRYVNNEEVGLYFKAADVVVLPYLSGTQSGITQVALAFETPMIATDVGGIGEVVKDKESGLLIPPGDSRAIAEALVRFFTDDMAPRLKENLRRTRGNKQNALDSLVKIIEAD